MIQAYDAAAVEYDQHVAGDAWMRAVLWERYARCFSAGQTVLDVGCGTGIDALRLAQRGIRVVAIDASPGMIAQARSKLAGRSSSGLVELRVMDLGDIDSLGAARFDGIISAFGCLSREADLRGFGPAAANLLRPGGVAMLHLLNRTSLWEWLGLVRSGRLAAARHLGSNPTRRFTIGGHRVQHQLYRANEAYATFFSEHFALRRAFGIGILRPPHTIRRLPSMVVAGLDRLERPLRAMPPTRDWGRFFVLELEKW